MPRPAARRGTNTSANRDDPAARSAADGASAELLMALLPPRREPPFQHEPEPRQRDAEDPDDEDRREHAGGVEILRGAHDQLAEPGRAEKELGRHHADEAAADRLA